MSDEQISERTIDKLHRETGIPMWALETAFKLSSRGMLDEETMVGMRVIPAAARVIAESTSEQLVDEVQRRMDQVVEAAVAWHQSDENWAETADKLGAAIDSLLELRSAPVEAKDDGSS